MTRRGWSWLIGGGAAVVALLLLLTTAPVVKKGVESHQFDVHASPSFPEAPPCATMRLRGNLESREIVPVVDVWGLAQVSAAIVSPVVYVGGDAPCPEGVDVGESQVIVFTPDCDAPANLDSDEPVDEVFTEPNYRCGGAGIALIAYASDEPSDEWTSFYEGQRYPLATSGVIAADTWCLGTEFGVTFGDGASSDSVPADVIAGDICVDLS